MDPMGTDLVDEAPAVDMWVSMIFTFHSAGYFKNVEVLLMEEIQHQLICRLFTRFYASQVLLWDFWTINSMNETIKGWKQKLWDKCMQKMSDSETLRLQTYQQGGDMLPVSSLEDSLPCNKVWSSDFRWIFMFTNMDHTYWTCIYIYI